MLKETNFKPVYSSGEDEPAEFFLDGLIESKNFDLALGFFSSSGFRALSLGFAYFIKHGGKMRMIINDHLTLEDKEAIEKGLVSSPEDLIEQRIIEDIIKLEKTLSGSDKHFFNCISWLIASKRLELIAIAPKNNSIGIAHQKFGIFTDAFGNRVAFNGSINFSNTALFKNIESISCYKSWSGEQNENARLDYFISLFDKIWDGNYSVVRRIPLENVRTSILEKFSVHDLQELINEESELIEQLSTNISSISLKFKIEKLRENLIGEKKHHPIFPLNKEPKDYQVEAFSNWTKSGYCGFFEMATGTGKTITALNCALEVSRIEKKYQILILVPTITLVDQWKEEAESFHFSNIIIANSKAAGWVEKTLRELNKSFIKGFSYCIITTYQTFNMDKFQSIISRLDSSTILIADEAHNLGTVRSQANYPIKFLKRIGLSATPIRHFDEEGTKSLLRFFNALEKPTFKLDMQEAIENGFLCQYYYYPKVVKLTIFEIKEYKEISKKLAKYFNNTSGSFLDNPVVSSLLLKRKRIIQKAFNKLDTLRSCLDELLLSRGSIKYTLVYVPEGKSNTFDQDDQKLINEYSGVISNEYKLTQHQFIGSSKDRNDILKRFGDGRIAVLTAMKCLDEGVDVKRTEIAIFCASTSNPRQFIQRRGRILRLHPEKKFAYIYDMIVVPENNEEFLKDSIEMEKSILASELKRVYEFASMSINKYQSLKILEEVASLYKINIFSSQISGKWL